MTPDDIKAVAMAALRDNPMFRDTVLAVVESAPECYRDSIAEMLWSAFVNAYWQGAQNNAVRCLMNWRGSDD